MYHADFLQRFVFEKASVRGEYVYLQESYQTIFKQHDYPPAIQKILGEALCIAALLTATIKFGGRLTVQFRGNGKLKLLLAECNDQFHLRGLAKWDGDLTYEELMEDFKNGVLVIIVDSGLNKANPYQGIVPWTGHSLVSSIEGYFRHSEQLATSIYLSVDEKIAVGFMLQILPEKENTDTTQETVSEWHSINSLTSQLNTKDLLNQDFQTLLQKLYPYEEIRIFPAAPVQFHCTCSRKRGEDALALLSIQEIEEELANKQVIVVTCDFCNKEYLFDRDATLNIIFKKNRPPKDAHLH